jgi:hypothetical protein
MKGNPVFKNLLRTVDLKAAAVAGAAGGAVYLATMEVDNRLTGQDIDDLKLLGRPFVRNPRLAKLVGVPIHLNNAIVLAVVYAAIARDRLPGPPWLRGIVFANVENTLLYPLVALETKHPGIRRGEIDRYFTLKAYVQSIPRHVTYGAVMAALYERRADV